MNNLDQFDKRTQLKIKINRGRYNILFFVLMSIINIFMITSGNESMMPYSSAISNTSVSMGVSASMQSGSETPRIIGLVISCAVLLLFMICYLFSKSKPLYLMLSLTLVIADTITLTVISASTNTLTSGHILLDLAIHALAIFYLLGSVRAYNELIRLPDKKDEPDANVPTQNVETQTHAFDDEEQFKDDNYAEEDLTKPICKYEDDSAEPLVSGTYNGLNIFAVIRNGKAELVINNYVCDELEIAYLNEFQLRAIVNDIDIVFDYRRTFKDEVMYLYADDTLLDSLGIG